MRVLFATPEFEGLIQVGGLGAVSAALPRALRSLADVRVVIPGYSAVLRTADQFEVIGQCRAIAGLPPCAIARTRTADGLTVYAVMAPQLFERAGGPYGDTAGNDWPDNDLRFARFASAAASLAAGEVDREWRADIVHANDWQSALVPAYLRWTSNYIPSVLTIHNLAYQGIFSKESLGRIGAPDHAFHVDELEFYGKVSFLKAGLVYASHLTTVSETYAKEIITPEFGCGLEGVLGKRSQANELSGILNGIDESWDPKRCGDISHRFGAGEWDGKQSNADHLRQEFGLALSRGPLFGLVTRLVHQKGIDLVLAAAETIISAGGQIVVMGQGEPELQHALQQAQERQRQSMSVALRFDPAEARRIFAGTDFTLMPSRFEPCGLSQMYAQRFGSLPIGHKTGGLADTIDDDQTGFLFDRPSTDSFMGALCRAFAAFGRESKLNRMRSFAMAKSFDWCRSASSYRRIYARVA